MEQRVAELERRLARAEQRVRVVSGAALVMLIGALVLLLASPALTRSNGMVVRAPFRVVDRRGKTLFKVERDWKGDGYLALSRASGKRAAEIGSTAWGG